MKKTMRYKEFIGSVECSVEDMVLHGELLFIHDLVTYEAESLPALKAEFEAAVDDYLETCRQLNRAPMKPCSGTLNVRIGPELHQKLAVYSTLNEEFINSIIKKSIVRFLNDPGQKAIVHNHYYEAPALELKAPYPAETEQKEGTAYVAGLQ